MTGAAARKRHNWKRKEELAARAECKWKDGAGQWKPRTAWRFGREAQRAVVRIFEMTGREYIKYECRVCQQWHIKPHPTRWRASLLVQMLE